MRVIDALYASAADLKKSMVPAFIMAWADYTHLHKRTLLGPAWNFLGYLFWVAGIYFFGRNFVGAGDDNYFSYITVGVAVWTALVAGIMNGATCYIRKTGIISSLPFSLNTYNLSSAILSTLYYIQYILLSALLLLCNDFHAYSSFDPILMFSSVGLFFVFSYLLSFTLGPIATKFRDILPMLEGFLRVMFFATPVFWRPNGESFLVKLNEYNPLNQFINISRSSLDSNMEYSLLVTIVYLLILILTSLISNFLTKRKIYYWL